MKLFTNCTYRKAHFSSIDRGVRDYSLSANFERISKSNSLQLIKIYFFFTLKGIMSPHVQQKRYLPQYLHPHYILHAFLIHTRKYCNLTPGFDPLISTSHHTITPSPTHPTSRLPHRLHLQLLTRTHFTRNCKSAIFSSLQFFCFCQERSGMLFGHRMMKFIGTFLVSARGDDVCKTNDFSIKKNPP